MDDLIRRNDAISLSFPVTFSNGLEPYDVDVVTVGHIKSVPAVDAVEVVRCGECEWWTKQESSIQGRCALYGIYPTSAWYCANGKHREDGENDDGI